METVSDYIVTVLCLIAIIIMVLLFIKPKVLIGKPAPGISQSIRDEHFDSGLLKCPNCKSTNWLEGPGGGSFGNIQCAKCKKKYNNLGPFGLQEI